MTFKWTYLMVAVVVLAAIAVLATTGGGWGSYSLAQGVGLILVGGFVIFMAQRASKRRLRPRELAQTPPSAIAAPFVGYPKDQALGIFDSERDATDATRDLVAEGYPTVNRFAGVRGAAEIDSQGEVHGGMAKAERTIEHIASDVSDLEEYDAAVRRGRIVLGVHVEDGERRHRVADIMTRHRGHDVRYFGSLSVESLSADPTRTHAD